MRNRGLAVALLSASVAVLVGAPRPVAAETVAVKFLEFNYCGVKPLCAADGGYDDTLANYVASFSPHVIAINEICETQFEALKADLAGRSGLWSYLGAEWRWQEDKPGCDGPNDRFGSAILTKNAIEVGSLEVLALDPPEQDRTFKVVCVSTAVSGVDLAACVTKLSATGSPNYSHVQVGPALTFAKNYAEGKALFIGGDFNVKVDENPFNGIYAEEGGNFQEMDQCQGSKPARSLAYPTICNRVTHLQIDEPSNTSKIDYMFLKQAWAKQLQPLAPIQPPPNASGEPISDHFITRGTATICGPSVC